MTIDHATDLRELVADAKYRADHRTLTPSVTYAIADALSSLLDKIEDDDRLALAIDPNALELDAYPWPRTASAAVRTYLLGETPA